MSTLTRPSPARTPRRDRYVGSRSSAWRTPSPRMPPSPREAPSTVHVCSTPSRARRTARRPPGARSSEIASPDAVSIVTPASPGAFWSAGSSVIRTSCRRRARVAAERRRRAATSDSGFQPSRDDSQPQNSSAGGERVLPVADRDRGDAAERARAAPAGRTRPRRARATASSAATRGRRRRRRSDELGRAVERLGDVGLVLGVDEHDLREPAQRVDRLVVPVRRPHHRREVGAPAAGRRSCRAWRGGCGPIVELHALARDGDVARPRLGVVGADARPRVDRLRARPRPRTAIEPRRVVAADALEPVLDLAAELAVDDDHEVQHPRGHERRGPTWWCSASDVAQRRLDLARASCRARDQTSSIRAALQCRPSPISSSASAGPGEPASYSAAAGCRRAQACRIGSMIDHCGVDLVVAREQRRVAAHRVEDQPLVGLGRLRHERRPVEELHVHRPDAHAARRGSSPRATATRPRSAAR